MELSRITVFGLWLSPEHAGYLKYAWVCMGTLKFTRKVTKIDQNPAQEMKKIWNWGGLWIKNAPKWFSFLIFWYASYFGVKGSKMVMGHVRNLKYDMRMLHNFLQNLEIPHMYLLIKSWRLNLIAIKFCLLDLIWLMHIYGKFGKYWWSTNIFLSELKWPQFNIRSNEKVNFWLSMDTTMKGQLYHSLK